MKDKELDNILYSSLKPEFTPSDKLNIELMDKLKNMDDSNNTGNGSSSAGNNKVVKASRLFTSNTPTGIFLKAAAIIIVVLCLGTAGVYAANHFLKKATVYDHGLAVGNQDYVSDEDLAAEMPPATETDDGHKEAGPNDKWITMDEKTVGGTYKNYVYVYPDYETVLEDTVFTNIFDSSIGESEYTSYTVVEEIGYSDNTATVSDASSTDRVYYRSEELTAHFKCGEGRVILDQSISEGVADDAAYSIALNDGAKNSRDYTSKNGLEFTLVDETRASDDGEESTATYVMLAYDDYTGFISFQGMTDDEIHNILDKINLNSEGDN